MLKVSQRAAFNPTSDPHKLQFLLLHVARNLLRCAGTHFPSILPCRPLPLSISLPLFLSTSLSLSLSLSLHLSSSASFSLSPPPLSLFALSLHPCSHPLLSLTLPPPPSPSPSRCNWEGRGRSRRYVAQRMAMAVGRLGAIHPAMPLLTRSHTYEDLCPLHSLRGSISSPLCPLHDCAARHPCGIVTERCMPMMGCSSFSISLATALDTHALAPVRPLSAPHPFFSRWTFSPCFLLSASDKDRFYGALKHAHPCTGLPPDCWLTALLPSRAPQVKWKTLEPEWNERFDFMVEDARHDMLIVSVFDHDMLGMRVSRAASPAVWDEWMERHGTERQKRTHARTHTQLKGLF